MSQRQPPRSTSTHAASAPVITLDLLDDEPTHVDDPPGFEEEEPSTHTAPDLDEDDDDLAPEDDELEWPMPDDEDQPVRH